MVSIKSCILVLLSVLALVGCGNSETPPASEQPVERANDTESFTKITAERLRSLAPGERITVDLRP